MHFIADRLLANTPVYIQIDKGLEILKCHSLSPNTIANNISYLF